MLVVKCVQFFTSANKDRVWGIPPAKEKDDPLLEPGIRGLSNGPSGDTPTSVNRCSHVSQRPNVKSIPNMDT